MIEEFETGCCIVGGGPAGMMLGYLLAREGVRVTVLEKHKDFFRDFRGDTVHPSTLEIFSELGILDDFLKLPHQRLTSLGGVIGGFAFQAADFGRVRAHCRFIALMPQWDFLDFLVREARKFPTFELRMEHEVTGLTRNPDRITGVEARTPGGIVRILASLTVGCDGRHSVTRKAAGLEVKETGVPIDVLWFRISRDSGDPEQLLGNVNFGRAVVLINRGDYFQTALIIPKDSFEEMRARGLEEFRATILRIVPYLGSRVEELKDWDQIKLLTVQINHLRKWHRPGLVCIGDAAHAMSPAGGVGINLAIQDAVAAARVLAKPLRDDRWMTDRLLAGVQRRREFPARVTQIAQTNMHRLLARIFRSTGPMKAPWQLKLALRAPGFRRLIGRMVGIGVRPEHVRRRSGVH